MSEETTDMAAQEGRLAPWLGPVVVLSGAVLTIVGQRAPAQEMQNRGDPYFAFTGDMRSSPRMV